VNAASSITLNVVRTGRVRRAKLYYLRNLKGKLPACGERTYLGSHAPQAANGKFVVKPLWNESWSEASTPSRVDEVGAPCSTALRAPSFSPRIVGRGLNDSKLL